MANPTGSAINILQMCGVLHLRGYQFLHIYPSMSPSGAHWRLTLAPACCFSEWHTPPEEHNKLFAHYSGSQSEALISWTLNEALTPQQLADKFIATFPLLVKYSKGENPAYRRWFSELTDFCIRHQALPWFQADWPYDLSNGIPFTGACKQKFRLPPESTRSSWKQWLLKPQYR